MTLSSKGDDKQPHVHQSGEAVKRYCVGCASRGYHWYDTDAINRMPRKIPCSMCGGNPQQPWRLSFNWRTGKHEFTHQDTREVRPYTFEGWPTDG